MTGLDELLQQLFPKQQPTFRPTAIEGLLKSPRQDELTNYDPTLRQSASQSVQGLLQNMGFDKGYSRQVSQSLLGGPSSSFPAEVGLADFVPGLGYALGAQDAIGGVEQAKQSFDQGNVGEAALQYALSSLGMLPAVAGSYIPTTPKKPDPIVGTRFETEFLGGLADQRPVNLEDYLGSSLMIMPWDSTSRNVAVKSVSDVNLPSQQITHGGQDYARDLIHQQQGIAGASGQSIAKRIKDREIQAIKENLAAGGTGGILHLPATMGAMAENFSVMPTNILLDVIDQAKPTKAALKELNTMVKNAPIYKKGVKTFPFKNFKGIDTESGRQQLFSGDGLDTTAGELRKMFVEKMYLKGNQEKFGFNAEDIVNSITDPNLRGVPKGFVGNTIIQGSPGGMRLSPSQNPSYNTDFTGRYLGTLGQNIPTEVLLPKRFAEISGQMAGKLGDLRTNTLGALEKRKKGVSELIDDEFLTNLQKYMSSFR